MYKNVGKKIQTLAKVVAILGIVLSLIFGLFCLYGGLNTTDPNLLLIGFIFCVIVPLMCWLSSLTQYGFGKLIETNEVMKNSIDELNSKVREIANK